tara:strand:- start:86 stop:1099 length:1014 start_codon:yes stop_codon:yes gene_type:complete
MENDFFIILLFIALNLIFILYFEDIKFFHINIDKPDSKRKLHKKPVPLAGGTIIFINLIFYSLSIFFNEKLFLNEILFKNQFNFILFFLSCFAIFILGFLDDKLNISAAIKFFIITLLIILILFLDEKLILDKIKFSFFDSIFYLSEFSIIFTCFCFLVYLNAFNMFDGINLQSCSYSTIIFMCILIFYLDIILIKILLISLVSYGYLNFKNKSFLGDSGSLLLAFIVSYVFIKLYNLNIINFSDEVVIFMLIPGIDLIRLFFMRVLKKKNPLSPDRLHLHHLLLLKFSYKSTLTIIILLISAPIILNFLKVDILYTIILTIFIYSFLITSIKRKKL